MPVDSPADDAFAHDLALVGRIDLVPALLKVAARTTGLGFTAIARVTDERWIACAVHDEIGFGLLPGSELPIATTICNEIRDCGRLVAIDHVADDPVYRDHQAPAHYGFQSYLSVPIWRHDGAFFGTLCAIDPRPHRVSSPETIGMFTLFANLIALHMDAQEKVGLAEAALSDELARSQLQEQFIAVLGHDLRSPLSAVRTGARFLIEKAAAMDPDVRRSAEIIERGARRMAGLIDDVLDFARGRLGGGLDVQPTVTTAMPETISHVATEVQTAWPGRTIESTLRFDGPVRCDARRVAQLLTNLLVNALTHGDGGPVRIAASGINGGLELSVSNTGTAIPLAKRRRLFLPFTRAEDGSPGAGLGLGLYIACEIAKAHRGSLDVASDDLETRFTFRTPTAR